MVFELQLSNAAGADISIDYQTIDGSAVAGADYQATSGRATIPAGASKTYVKAPVIDDQEFENGRAETFTLRLHNPNHYVLAGNSELRVTGRIFDNEEPPEGEDYVPARLDTVGEISVGESWLNGNPVMGRIEQENDQDWYRTRLTRSHCYQIEIRSSYYEDEGLTLSDLYLHGVIRDDGVWLPGTNNDDGGTHLSALHTLRFNRTGAYYIAVGHAWYDKGGIFDLSVIDLGTVTRTCSEIDVDNLTYTPGHFDEG